MTPIHKPGENQYRCAACGGVFDKGWSDEDAKAEHTKTFPETPLDDCAIVCDDCYKRMGFGA